MLAAAATLSGPLIPSPPEPTKRRAAGGLKSAACGDGKGWLGGRVTANHNFTAHPQPPSAIAICSPVSIEPTVTCPLLAELHSRPRLLQAALDHRSLPLSLEREAAAEKMTDRRGFEPRKATHRHSLRSLAMPAPASQPSKGETSNFLAALVNRGGQRRRGKRNADGCLPQSRLCICSSRYKLPKSGVGGVATFDP